MGIFDVPRLHVFGRFYADPSSVNNDPDHYLSTTTNPSPWQMPKGRHYFRFEDCKVMSALGPDGQPINDGSMIGQAMRSTDEPMPGRIVDLDVYQQAVTQLFGVEIVIGDPETDNGYLKGKMDTPVLNGNSFNFVQPTRGWDMQYGWGSYGGDSNAIGVFQTVIRVNETDWKFPSQGPWGALREACQVVVEKDQIYRLLSFKFLLDGYWNVIGSTDYQYGRMTGTIGPQKANQPRETPGARWLEARPLPDKAAWNVPFFYRAPFALDSARNVLLIDWSGSVSRLSVGGDPVPLGTVTARANTPGGPVDLGTVRIDSYVYQMQGGISEIKLTSEQTAAINTNPLELWTSRTDIGDQKLFGENKHGVAYATQNRSIRMTSDPGLGISIATASVHVTKWGRPFPGTQLNFKVISVKGDTPGITVPPGYPGNKDSADGALAASISPTNSDGVALVKFKAIRGVEPRTDELDGELYFCYAYFDGEEPWGKNDPNNPENNIAPRQEAQISVLVWSAYPVKEKPTWADVQPLMAPYAKLFPAMSDKFRVDDERAFDFYSNNPGAGFFLGPNGKFNIPGHPEIQDGAIPYYLTLPIESPLYMPVTRDLSPNKIATLINYISLEQAAVKAKSDAEEKKGTGSDE